MMSTRDFLYGFMQGFNEAGGTNKLSSWAAKNIADGKYYTPQNDPLFYQELQKAKELNTPAARQDFISEYGDYFDIGDMSAEEYFFSPAEGSPEWMDRELSKINLDNQRLLNQLSQEYLPSEYELQRRAGEADTTVKETYAQNYPELMDLQIKEGSLDLEQKEELFPLQKQMTEEQLNELQTRNNYLGQSLEQQLTAGELQNLNLELQNEIARREIELQRELKPYEIEQVKQNVIFNAIRNKTAQNNLDFQVESFSDRLLNLNLGNEYQRMQNELLGLDLERQQALSEAGYNIGSEPDTIFDWDRYIGVTPDGRPVMETIAGGRLALRPDGSLDNWTGSVIGPDFVISETTRVGNGPDRKSVV